MVPRTYEFRPMTAADLPLVRRWLRAIRAHEKAGFCWENLVDTPDGHALLMIRDASPA
jgi:hypothetical protein